MKLGIIVFANDSGLGAQTRRLTYMLKPFRILVIDSSSFSKNQKQHFEWYDNFQGYRVNGFPTNKEIRVFIKGLTHVLVCENPLNFILMSEAKRFGIKVYIQSNYEFCDHLIHDITLPHKFLMPSYWHIDTMKSRFGDDRVIYLPPPIDANEFNVSRETNFNRQGKRRFLHIVGTLAANDRNGTLALLHALQYAHSDFELVIRSQHELPPDYIIADHRVTYAIENINDAQQMYTDFDALILPRRYGGLSLTTNEALMSAMPVIMPNISPNSELLPKEWLVNARMIGTFIARSPIEIFETYPQELAQKIDWFTNNDIAEQKSRALEIAYESFSTTKLLPKYLEALND